MRLQGHYEYVEQEGLYIQPTDRLYRCAMAVTIQVQNISTKCLSCCNGNLSPACFYAIGFDPQRRRVMVDR